MGGNVVYGIFLMFNSYANKKLSAIEVSHSKYFAHRPDFFLVWEGFKLYFVTPVIDILSEAA